MKAINRCCWVLCLALLGLTACSHSDSPSSTAEPTTIDDRQHLDDEATRQVVHKSTTSEPSIPVDETVEHYSDGTIRRKSESYVDESGQQILHGTFVEFYPNGNRFSAGSYAHGKRHGPWKFWYEDGPAARVARYQLGVPEGRWLWYRSDGTRSREASYANGKLDGESVYFAEDGKAPRRLESFREGRRHGLLSRWYDSGQKAVEIEFKDGVPDGREIRWHLNGQKQAEGFHRNGSPDGVFSYWASDGTPIKSVEWRNGRRVSRLVQRGQRES